ncbi:MAG: L,D-transpeptidase family protein [Bacteroidetes bacterium]|nr:L,D-transpeptidase family protein [Bacteroidota bacterium]
MKHRQRTYSLLFSVIAILLYACQENHKPAEKDIVSVPEKIQEHLSEDIKSILDFAAQNNSAINDSVMLGHLTLDRQTYEGKNFEGIWSSNGHWLLAADSLFQYIENCKYDGLFASDYHYSTLSFIHRVFNADTIARKNIALWAKADLLMTDAYFKLVRDIKQGRLKYDSVTLRTDSLLSDSVYTTSLNEALQSNNIAATLHNLEPKHAGYDSLIESLRDFLSTANLQAYTYLKYPYKDSLAFYTALKKRLNEVNFLPKDSGQIDTTAISVAIKKYQGAKKLRQTGKPNQQTVDDLNETDLEKFKRIAINLDRYKLLPDTLPHAYIWVNLPGFYLKAYDNDTVVFESKVIVGKPLTPTPLLSSEVTNFVTLPQWTVPTSIIFKEMLPKIKKNVDFLRKENLMVVDNEDNVVDPNTVNWAKLNKNHFPYQIKQQQGDNNSLGVIKFNFRNKYSVYMHDTNVRYMFGKSFRALSHGCVRVQQWVKLSDYLIRNDTMRYHPDTLRAWIKRQEKHTVGGFARVPVYFRYFTCEGKNGRVKFYDDVYAEDKILREKYFADKSVN